MTDEALFPAGYTAWDCHSRHNKQCGCKQLYKTKPDKPEVQGLCSARCTKQQCAQGQPLHICRATTYTAPQCRVHGCHAEQGSSEFLQELRDAGFTGRCYVQWPVKSDPAIKGHRQQSGKNKGKTSKKNLRLDMMLIDGPVGKKYSMVPVEIQGSSHDANGSQQGQDQIKSTGVKHMGLDQVMHVCAAQFVPFVPRNAVRPARKRQRKASDDDQSYAHMGKASIIEEVLAACHDHKSVEELTRKKSG